MSRPQSYIEVSPLEIDSESQSSPLEIDSESQTSPLEIDSESQTNVETDTPATQLPASDPSFGHYNRDMATLATDVLAAVFPLACLGFVAALFNLRDKPVSQSSHKIWLNAIIVFASAFPIAFAAIIGRLTYQVGRYKLERGTTIGFLEQMLGSRTFGGTILTQINLGTFNIVAGGLVVLWAFSPLGTQALLRALSTKRAEYPTPLAVTYRDTMSNLDLLLLSTVQYLKPLPVMYKYFFGKKAVMLVSLLMMPDHIQTSAMDHWDNVKIPFLSKNNRVDEITDGGWQTIKWSTDSGHERFSALAGVQIEDVPVGNTTLTMESSYIELDCYNITLYLAGEVNRPDIQNVSWDWTSFYAPTFGSEQPINVNSSWQGFNDSRWTIAVNRFVDTATWANDTWFTYHKGLQSKSEDVDRVIDTPAVFIEESGIEVNPTTLYFYSRFGDSRIRSRPTDSISAQCDVRQKYVETRVLCERKEESARQNCTATAQRPSTKPHASELISFLNFPSVFEKISDHLPKIGSEVENDLPILYLANPSVKETDFGTDFKDVDESVLSRRLSQLINTYILLISFDYGGARNGTKRIGVDKIPIGWLGYNITDDKAETTVLIETYHVSTLWIILSFVCCVVFMLGGIASIVFTHLSDTPELLGYASTALRDSKFFDLPPGSSRMHATDLSKMIQEYRVRYGRIQTAQDEEPLLGVGLEDESTPITVGVKSHSDEAS